MDAWFILSRKHSLIKKKNQQMLPLLITLLEIVALVQQLTLPDILGMLCHL